MLLRTRTDPIRHASLSVLSALVAAVFVIFVLVAAPLPVVAIRSNVAAKGTMTVCVLMWGSITDGGFTEAHNRGMLQAIDELEERYPTVRFTAPIVQNAHEGTNAEKEARVDALMSNNDCDMLLATFNDVYGRWEHFVSWVARRPQTLFIVEDARLASLVENVVYTNLMVTATSCGRAWYLAGYAAGVEGGSGGCVGMVVAFADVYIDMQYAFYRGVVDSGANIRAEILPVGAWASQQRDFIAATTLLDIKNCTMLAHITDEPTVNNLVVARGGALRSIGWTFDRRTEYGQSVLISVLRDYVEMFGVLIAQWIEDDLVSKVQYFDCRISSLSSGAKPVTRTRFLERNATLLMKADVWTRSQWRDKATGVLMYTGALNETTALTLTFVPENMPQHPTLRMGSECPLGSSASYAPRAADGLLDLVCTQCPPDTFRDATSSANFSCTACPPGKTAPAGSSACVEGGGGGGGVLNETQIIVLVVVLVGVAVIAMIGLGGYCLMRRTAELVAEASTAGTEGTRTITGPTDPFAASGSMVKTTTGTLPQAATSSTSAASTSEFEAERARRIELIKNNFFYVGNIIGKGASGIVYKVVLQDGSALAMKEIMNSEEADCRELQIAANLPPHPNIVRHYAVRYNREKCSTMIFMELMTSGSLRSVVKEVHRSLADVTARAFTTQIVSAVAFLHRANVVHRDLKADNCLLDSEGRCKLADFGTARRITESVTSMSFVGTPLWIAPEVLRGAELPAGAAVIEAAKKADIWSIGVLVAEMLGRGRPPWPEFESTIAAIQYIERSGPMVLPQGITATAKDFIAACTQRDPMARPSCEELLAHPWLSSDPTTNTSTSLSLELDGDGAEGEDGAQGQLRDAPQRGYTIGPVIGVGAFGSVHRATLADGTVVAVKSLTFNTNDRALAKRLRRLSREIGTMKQLDHPNIVRYLFTDRAVLVKDAEASNTANRADQVMLIFMEYLGSGTLKALIDKKKGMNEADAVHYIAAILRGLEYLHSKGIVHRDVKTSNALIAPAPVYAKLSDFGTATTLGANATVSLTMQGTLSFMCPSIVREEAPTTAADIWSTGATAMELLTGVPPWTHLKRGSALAIASYVASDEPIVLPPGLSPLALDFLSQCLVRDVAQRATASQLLRHPWLRPAASDGGAQ